MASIFFTTKWGQPDRNNIGFNPNLLTQDGTYLLLVSPYVTSNPVATILVPFSISPTQFILYSGGPNGPQIGFSASETLPSNTSLTYQIVINGVPYWYNSLISSWAAAGSVSSSVANSSSVLNTQLPNIFSQLNIVTPVFMSINVFFGTSDGVSTPKLSQTIFYYTWGN